MKVLCKFQIDIPINARVTAVQSLKDSIQLYCGSHDGGQKNGHQPIFPYYVIENSPTSLAPNSVLVGPNNFKFGTEARCMVLQAIPKFGAN